MSKHHTPPIKTLRERVLQVLILADWASMKARHYKRQSRRADKYPQALARSVHYRRRATKLYAYLRKLRTNHFTPKGYVSFIKDNAEELNRRQKQRPPHYL